MKNFLGIDVDTGVAVADYTVVRRISQDLMDEQDELANTSEDFEKNAEPPKWYENLDVVLRLFFSIGVTVGICSMLLAVEGQYYNQLWIGILAFIVGIGCGVGRHLLKSSKEKRHQLAENSPEARILNERADELYARTMHVLKVPEDALHVDVFMYPYQMQNERAKAASPIKYVMAEMRVFTEKDYVCFADTGAVYTVPQNGTLRLKKVKQNFPVTSWFKKDFDDYKRYLNLGGLYPTTKGGGVLTFSQNGTNYELFVAPYELSRLAELLNLTVEEA